MKTLEAFARIAFGIFVGLIFPILLSIPTLRKSAYSWIYESPIQYIVTIELLSSLIALIISLIYTFFLYGKSGFNKSRVFLAFIATHAALQAIIPGTFTIFVYIAEVLIFCAYHEARNSPRIIATQYSIFAFVIAVPLLSISNIALVTLRAETITNGAPYCIAIPDNKGLGYYPAKSLFDLNGFNMRAVFQKEDKKNYYLFQHNALIIQGTSNTTTLNWSYKKMNFSNEARNFGEKLTCEPTPHFALALPLL